MNNKLQKAGRLPIRTGLSSLQREMNRLFDDFWAPMGTSSLFPETSDFNDMFDFSPTLDVKENDGQYVFNLDVPGVDKKDIKIELQENHLVVSGERKEERDDKQKNSYSYESRYGSFRRVIPLTGRVDIDKIDATYNNGVLTIAVPKSEADKPRQISVKDGKAASAKEPELKTTGEAGTSQQVNIKGTDKKADYLADDKTESDKNARH